jgi:hypothetical protein
VDEPGLSQIAHGVIPIFQSANIATSLLQAATFRLNRRQDGQDELESRWWTHLEPKRVRECSEEAGFRFRNSTNSFVIL